MSNTSIARQLTNAISAAAKAHDADIFLLSGDISAGLGHNFIDLCPLRSLGAGNCILFLITSGGDLEAAYRITRCIQNRYADGNFILFTDGVCKRLRYINCYGCRDADHDRPRRAWATGHSVMVRDEFGESESGLIDTDALRKLLKKVFNTFQYHFGRLKIPRKWQPHNPDRVKDGL